MAESDETIEQRLRRLEELAFEGDGLVRSVARLSTVSAALGEALIQVDRNQQALTQLGKQLNEVESTAARSDEVQRIQKKERGDRRRLVWVTTSVTLFIAFTGTLLVSDAAHDSCEKRHQASMAVVDTLRSFRSPENAPLIDAGVDRIEATLTEPCDDQYPLHLP